MKKLFIHQPLFRLLSPLFSGVIAYLLILLVNNNVGQLQEEFLGEELYVCIGLSYIIQELSRFLLILFNKIPRFNTTILSLGLQALISLLVGIGIITISITLYYKNILGFSPDSEELWLFNSIFSSITIIYILLFISHQYLYRVNTEKLKEEEQFLSFIEEDFKEFKEGINPELLFESLENLLVLIQNDKEKADDFIDYLATIYRYILASKEQQLVTIDLELENTIQLVNLFNYLPYRNVIIKKSIQTSFLIVPRALLFLVEQIIRTTIISSQITLEIFLEENEDSFKIYYNINDKITSPFTLQKITEIQRVYRIYSDYDIEVNTTDITRTISIPKLTTKTKLTT